MILLAGLAAYLATRPDEFRGSRAAILPAAPEAVFAQVNDFHRWADWSPWAKLDPQARETFSGPAAGVGAAMAWTMTGRNNFLGKAMSLVMDCGKLVGDQFAAGLADLGRAAAPK